MNLRRHPKLNATLALSVLLIACKSEPPPLSDEASVSATQTALTNGPEITVYKSPTCGCCTAWVSYLEEEGFQVTAIDRDDVDSIKTKLGLTNPALKSCHTAVVDGYVVEGHVPANDITRILSERPSDIIGISAPGMPMLSPGMASREPKNYAVVSFTDTGEPEIYSQY